MFYIALGFWFIFTSFFILDYYLSVLIPTMSPGPIIYVILSAIVSWSFILKGAEELSAKRFKEKEEKSID